MTACDSLGGMAFTVSGEFWMTGHHASVTWAEGALSGDLVVIARLKELARRYACQGAQLDHRRAAGGRAPTCETPRAPFT